ncbi:MAG TPA: ADP-forming succinate--CoA ligase subunit beta [Firmicutes bacterium]|nr:ADP-forming succinate--CoA ligase subunit beta [Bacillota bacterium]
MDLLEYQGKQLLAARGLKTPRGGMASSPAEAEQVAAELGCPVVVKAQVPAGKRGKAGGVRPAETPAHAAEVAASILGMRIRGHAVEAVLVEEKLSIARELYAGVTISPRDRAAVLMFSAHGGMDVEEVVSRFPVSVVSLQVDGMKSLWQYHFLELAKKGGVVGDPLPKVADVLHRLVRLAFDLDATTAEINPLVVTAEGQGVAADAKVVIDDAALFRHPDLKEKRPRVLDPLEATAREAGLAYVPLDGGSVGIIAGGAGLAMATMDTVFALGGRPANFLDVGGGVSTEGMATAVRVTARSPGVEGIVINVFGGINNCEVMARGIARVLDEDKLSLPLVVKMRGHSQEEGWAILAQKGVDVIKDGTTGEAVSRLLALMNGERN